MNAEDKKKGQMLLIAGIFILIGLVLISNLLGIYNVFEEKRAVESRFAEKSLENLEREYARVVGLSASQPDFNASGIEDLANFSRLVRNNPNAKVMYVYVFANSTSDTLSATAGNYLNDDLNITITPEGATPSSVTFVLNDQTNETQHFTAGDGPLDVNVTWTSANTNHNESFSVTTSSNQVFGFFDIQMEEENFLVRSKTTYNYTWS